MPATKQDLDPWFIGIDAEIVVTMPTDQDTRGWTVVMNIRPTPSGTPSYTVPTTGGTMSVGGGSNHNVITIDVPDPATSGLSPGVYSYEVKRTDSGAKDILVYGSLKIRYPSAA